MPELLQGFATSALVVPAGPIGAFGVAVVGAVEWTPLPAAALTVAAAVVALATPLLLGWRPARRLTRRAARATNARALIGRLRARRAKPGAAEAGMDPHEPSLRQIANRLNQIFWIADERLTEVEYVSPAFEVVWGRPCSALYRDVGSLLRAVHPSDRRRLYRAGEAVRRGVSRLDVECRIIRSDGQLRWIRVRGARLEGHDGASGGIGGTVEDVTERKRVEAMEHVLSEAGQILASTLDREETLKAVANLAVASIADYCIVYRIREGGQIQRVEFAHADPSKGPVVRELLGRYESDLDALFARVARRRTPVLRSDVSESLLSRLCRDDRHAELIRTLEPRSLVVAPLVAREQALGAIVLASGSSSCRYGSGDLALAVELANRITLALDNVRLYRAAVGASQAKSDFLAVVGHELRTPLTAIMGYTDLLMNQISGPLSEAQRRQLGSIDRASRQLVRLIDEILTFSRLGAGRETVQTEPVDLVRCVGDILETTGRRARAKGLDVRVELPDRPIRVETDPASLRHILRSLLSNAVKFTERGSIEFSVRAGDSQVVFTVRDTGVGIPPGKQELIFAPFWQAESATIREAGGTGLGLSIARRITRLLGGDIGVDSEPGRGSTFTVRIPVGPAPAAEVTAG